MSNDPRGTIIQQGNVLRINNAFVEEASCTDNSNGFILVSYAVHEGNNTSIQILRLNLNRNTSILTSFGQKMCICCLQRGMWVNVVFSSAMTMSIPPQSNALLVVVQGNFLPPWPPSRPGLQGLLQPPWPPSATQTSSAAQTSKASCSLHGLRGRNPQDLRSRPGLQGPEPPQASAAQASKARTSKTSAAPRPPRPEPPKTSAAAKASKARTSKASLSRPGLQGPNPPGLRSRLGLQGHSHGL